MNNGSSIRIVCFDLGGVIIRICRSWEEGCKAAGIDSRPNPQSSFTILDSHRSLVQLYQTGAISCDEFARQLSAQMHSVYSPEEVKQVHHAWMLGQYEGVESVIDRIHSRGWTTAALSNTNHSHWQQMHRFPAVMKLHHRFASHELGLFKPELAIFHEFERRVGATGQQIMFFDDLPENVEAARQLNWRAHLIDPFQSTASQMHSALDCAELTR